DILGEDGEQCRFEPSRSEWDWLGDGIYFFQDSSFHAWDHARFKARSDNSEPVVLRAQVELTDCLDLFNPKFYRALKDVYALCDQMCAQFGVPLPRQLALRDELKGIQNRNPYLPGKGG